MKTHYIKGSRHAFTLSELMVTVVIIGLLAAILLPVIGRAKMKAKRTVSINNLKQMALAYAEYAQENGQTMPYSRDGHNSAWTEYMRERGAFDEASLNSPVCGPNTRSANDGGEVITNRRVPNLPKDLSYGTSKMAWGIHGINQVPIQVPVQVPIRVAYQHPIIYTVREPVEMTVTNRVADGKIPYVVSVTNRVQVLVGTQSSEDPWVHLVGVHNRGNNTITIYVNGEKQSSKSCGIFNRYFNATSIGRWNLQSPDHRGDPWCAAFRGQIDDIAVYSRALSDEEVVSLYQNGAASMSDGLEAHYQFNGNANDTSGHGKHGTVEGPVLSRDRNGRENSAYTFDGIDDQILIRKPIITNNSCSYTTSAWIRKEGAWHDGMIMSDRPGPGGPSEGYKYYLYMSNGGGFAAGAHIASPWRFVWTSSKRYSTWPEPNKYETRENVREETRYRTKYKNVVRKVTRYVNRQKTRYETRYRTQYVTRNVTRYVQKPKMLTSGTYSINAWAQSGHPLAESQWGKFYTTYESGGSNTPIFTGGIAPDVMPRSTDRAPSSLLGEKGGMSRICINRYGRGSTDVAFMDGSVRSISLPKLWTLKWHQGWKAPFRLPKLPSN